MTICDAFGVDYGLLGSAKGNTFENKKESRKQMYETAIIPSMDEKVGALNQFIGADSKSWDLEMKWNHLAVFDENKKERATSLKLSISALSQAYADGAITIQQYQQELAKFNI